MTASFKHQCVDAKSGDITFHISKTAVKLKTTVHVFMQAINLSV